MQLTLHRQIEKYIEKLENGSVIAVSDFATIANPKTASKNLERLCKKGLIEKVIRGIFWKPDGINTSPSEEEVANAIARSNKWRIVPCGNTALHKLGLVNNTPTKWTYITDGTYRNYSYGGKSISFQHTNKWVSSISFSTALLIQAIKAYGNKALPKDVSLKLKMKYKLSEKKKIIKETEHLTSQTAKTIKQLFLNNEIIKGDSNGN